MGHFDWPRWGQKKPWIPARAAMTLMRGWGYGPAPKGSRIPQVSAAAIHSVALQAKSGRRWQLATDKGLQPATGNRR
jgi:hypothetical protein